VEVVLPPKSDNYLETSNRPRPLVAASCCASTHLLASLLHRACVPPLRSLSHLCCCCCVLIRFHRKYSESPHLAFIHYRTRFDPQSAYSISSPTRAHSGSLLLCQPSSAPKPNSTDCDLVCLGFVDWLWPNSKRVTQKAPFVDCSILDRIWPP
jgi:hypothetical protein